MLSSVSLHFVDKIDSIKSLRLSEIIYLIRRDLWTIWIRISPKHRLIANPYAIYRYLNKSINDHSLVSHFQGSERKFYFDHDIKNNLRGIYKHFFRVISQDIIRQADSLCNRTYQFFGAKYSFNEEAIDWHLEPMSNKSWPKLFFKDIKYIGYDRIGDIKIPWEFNRHQFLVTLAQAYYISGDEQYAHEIVSLIESWMEANQPYRGINWISALEIGMRLLSWTFAFHFIRESRSVTKKFLRTFLIFILIQTMYIERNLTIGRYANNHLIGEAASLVIVGLYFHEFKMAQRWVKKGISLLEKELVKQIYPDGGGVEQAFGYLGFIVELCLLSFRLASINDIKISEAAWNRIQEAFEFMMFTALPNGKAPNFGDSDDARPVFFCNADLRDFGGILAVGAALFKRADFKSMSGGPSEELLWLMGQKGCSIHRRLENKQPQTRSCLFTDSGYAVLRDSWSRDANYLIFDCGPLGYKTGAHGHADALSIQLAVFGQLALVDPGTFAYNQDQTFRNYFRGTRAHNTVTVDNKDQAEIMGRMRWKNIPRSFIHYHYFSDQLDIVCGEHHGYRRLSFPAVHRRTLLFVKDPSYFLAIDRMIAAGVHTYALNFHFMPGTLLAGNNPIVAQLPRCNGLVMHVNASDELSLERKEGDPLPMGWYSAKYGHKIASPALSFRCTGENTLFCSLIVPYHNSPLSVFLSRAAVGDNETINVEVEYEEFSDTILISDQAKEFMDDTVNFAGRCALIRLNSKRSVVHVYGFDVTKFILDGTVYLDSEKPVSGFIVGSADGP